MYKIVQHFLQSYYGNHSCLDLWYTILCKSLRHISIF